MKKTPSYLKGLASRRGRAAGDIERIEGLVAHLQEHIAQARKVVAYCDGLIVDFDKRLDPSTIAPIRGVTRYGKRGSLVKAILAELRKAEGEAVTTIELGIALQARFRLDFTSWEERRRWVKNSVTPALKDLVAAGLVERLHDPESKSGETGRWRLANRVGRTVDQLRTSAEVAGLATQQVDEAA